MSVTITLEDEIDLSRGDMLVSPAHAPRVSRHFDAMVVWFNVEHAELGKTYLLKHTSRTVRGKATKIHYRADVNSLEHESARTLSMNDIAYVEFETVSPLFFDPYTQNRITGSFILIDPISNATLGAGMIRADLSSGRAVGKAAGEGETAAPVTAAERYKRHGHGPALVLASGSLEFAKRLERALFDGSFETQLLSSAEIPLSVFEQLYPALESAGLVVIYSCEALSAEAKRRLATLAGNRLFDLAALGFSASDPNAVEKAVLRLQSLRK